MIIDHKLNISGKMGDEPSTSKSADNTRVETQPWTRDLKLLPPFTYNKLQKHLGLDSHKIQLALRNMRS
jgi:hypothetical protein